MAFLWLLYRRRLSISIPTSQHSLLAELSSVFKIALASLKFLSRLRLLFRRVSVSCLQAVRHNTDEKDNTMECGKLTAKLRDAVPVCFMLFPPGKNTVSSPLSARHVISGMAISGRIRQRPFGTGNRTNSVRCGNPVRCKRPGA